MTMSPDEIIEKFLKAKHPGANWIQRLVEEAFQAGRIKGRIDGLEEAHRMMPMQVVWYPKGTYIDANDHGHVLNSSRKKIWDHALSLKKGDQS